MNIHCSVQVAVYPRWRGEHVTHFVLMDGDTGLSPLARGTHEDQFYIMAKVRFIPAGAGNTATHSAAVSHVSVYPRWRGEHESGQIAPALAHGLSPLARGTPDYDTEEVTSQRFIPAGAGNTAGQLIALRAVPVYPRWRGEHVTMLSNGQGGSGLSPLARGTHEMVASHFTPNRFIPAGAGNTLTISYCFIINLSTKNNLPTFLQQIDVFKEP